MGVSIMDNTSRDENKAWSLLEKVGNLAILNFLFLISSLPLVTIGTALADSESSWEKYSRRQRAVYLYDLYEILQAEF